MTAFRATSWCRSYVTCRQSQCTNWIWQDKLKPDTRCRQCGTWWPALTVIQGGTGKGKGQGRPTKTEARQQASWLETPPGLGKLKPLKKTKIQKEATDLLEPVWSGVSHELQDKLQHLGIGPKKPPEPDLHEMLKTHMAALPAQVQEVVTRLTTPAPASEQDIAIKLKGQVADLKNLSTKKTQLQEKLDQTKLQYQTLLQEMQDLQQKLNEGQQALKLLSEDYMKAVNKETKQADLDSGMDIDTLPAAVETFVANLGVSLSDEQKTQLHGLLKRPNDTDGDLSKRRKTDSPAKTAPPGSDG